VQLISRERTFAHDGIENRLLKSYPIYARTSVLLLTSISSCPNQLVAPFQPTATALTRIRCLPSAVIPNTVLLLLCQWRRPMCFQSITQPQVGV
jgi:hypothetical protein